MTQTARYSKTLDSRLSPLLERREFAALRDVLSSLSHAQFRMAGIMIGERYALRMDTASFWALARCLVEWDSKAFLVTMLKAAVLRAGDEPSFMHDEGFADFCTVLNDVDKSKLLARLLPVARHHDDVPHLFALVGWTDRRQWLQPLMQVSSMPCYYTLFRALRTIEDDRPYLIRTAVYLMKKGDSLSFNMACLVKEYFALDEVKGTFSMKLKPYQFSRVETSYDAFRSLMSI